ncbi:hypothetical protein F383_08165 [Gossypium arboreum]|uniref:Uncharacterized protein n=1 Tax=Gossypium arboreum TaxID=29729 RepID=A0A0B0PIR3_GOSAR|nr:hypothetical protein F383_08165 [Gossypium arboreum]
MGTLTNYHSMTKPKHLYHAKYTYTYMHILVSLRITSTHICIYINGRTYHHCTYSKIISKILILFIHRAEYIFHIHLHSSFISNMSCNKY